jgi:hypothetical protein
MSTPDVPATGWFTSSYSIGGSPDCVEVHLASDVVYVRHSRHPADTVIRYTHTEWHTFTRSVKADEFDPATGPVGRQAEQAFDLDMPRSKRRCPIGTYCNP